MRNETINEIKGKRSCDVVSARGLETHAVGEQGLACPGRRDQNGRTVDFLDRPKRLGVHDVHGLERQTGLHFEGKSHGLEQFGGLPFPEAMEELSGEERAEDGRRGAAFLRREVRVPGRDTQAIALPRDRLPQDLGPGAQLPQAFDRAHGYFFEPRGT
jgi:hypothetical protein